MYVLRRSVKRSLFVICSFLCPSLETRFQTRYFEVALWLAGALGGRYFIGWERHLASISLKTHLNKFSDTICNVCSAFIIESWVLGVIYAFIINYGSQQGWKRHCPLQWWRHTMTHCDAKRRDSRAPPSEDGTRIKLKKTILN